MSVIFLCSLDVYTVKIKNRMFIFGARVSFEKRIRGDLSKSGVREKEEKIFFE
jgi:hypothetical protein